MFVPKIIFGQWTNDIPRHPFELKSEVSERTTVWSKPPPLKIFCEALRVAEYVKITGRISAKPPGTIAEYQQIIRKHSCIISPKTTVWTKPSPSAGVQIMLKKDDPEYHILRARNFKPGFPNVCINQKSKYLKSLQNLKALQYLTFLQYQVPSVLQLPAVPQVPARLEIPAGSQLHVAPQIPAVPQVPANIANSCNT